MLKIGEWWTLWNVYCFSWRQRLNPYRLPYSVPKYTMLSNPFEDATAVILPSLNKLSGIDCNGFFSSSEITTALSSEVRAMTVRYTFSASNSGSSTGDSSPLLVSSSLLGLLLSSGSSSPSTNSLSPSSSLNSSDFFLTILGRLASFVLQKQIFSIVPFVYFEPSSMRVYSWVWVL